MNHRFILALVSISLFLTVSALYTSGRANEIVPMLLALLPFTLAIAIVLLLTRSRRTWEVLVL